MNNKQKGIIGEFAVAKFLASKNLPVFKEIGDNCKVDIISIINNKTIKIQVKTVSSNKNNSVSLSLKTSGPNYEYFYNEKDIDVFALYLLDEEEIAWITVKDIKLRERKGIVLRKINTKNNQIKNTNYIKDYSFDRFINNI